MPPMTRAEALARYRDLPLPDTTQEAWRFTDLKGFDPDAFGSNGSSGTAPKTGTVPTAMLDIDVAGIAHVSEKGIEIERAPHGVLFETLIDHERLGTLVGADDKFTAHNAASWEHGLLVHVPKGVELEQPLYVRVANSNPDGSTFWRLLVIADEGARFTLIEEYASASPELAAYSNAAVELFVDQGARVERVRRAVRLAGRDARVRLAPDPLARHLALRHPPRPRRARRRARLGRPRLRLPPGQDKHAQRPLPPRRDRHPDS